MSTADASELTCPYPGLRPFRPDEAYLFFGRDEQRNQLLRKLNERNFVAVVGTSGCGKSSLILAGLIPDLKLGLLGPGRVKWRVALVRPGDRPMDNLSEALLTDDALGTILPAPLLRQGLRRGPLSLAELISGSRPDGSPVLAPGENLLLLIDQFEEIFRFRKAAEPAKDRSAGHDRDRIDAEDPNRARNRERIRAEADAFVALILESVRRAGTGKAGPAPDTGPDGPAAPPGDGPADVGPGSPSADGGGGGLPLFVILTMRSDFLGDCALFPGLPELLSDSQFLTPRLSRPQRRQAIEGPAKVEGGQVEPILINRLLNDMGAAPDQLPLMQHALMRLWLEAEKATPRDPGGEATAPITLKLPDYEAMNGMAGALDLDASRAYDALDPESRRIAEVMFRLLSERGDGRLDTRRLARVGEVARVAGVPEAAVLAVVARFRTPDLNLLSVSGDVLDVTHESVIRNWRSLNRWVEDEAKAAETYRLLRTEARRFADDQRNHLEGDRLGPRMLENALAWRGDATPPTATMQAAKPAWRPGPAWAERYGPVEDFEQVLGYIRLNEEQAGRERLRAQRRKRRLQAIPIAILAALIFALVQFARGKIRSAEEQAQKADSTQKRVTERVEAIQKLSRKLEVAGQLDPFSALNLARSLQADPGDTDWAQDEQVREFLALRKDELQRQNALLASRTLSFGALTALSDGYPQRAVLLGVEAVDESQAVGGNSAEIALDALRQALRALGGRPMIGRDASGASIAHRRAVTGMVASPDGRWVATSSTDASVMIWDLVKPGRSLRLPHEAPVSGVSLSPDGRWLVSFSYGRPAQLWDLQAGSPFDRPAPRPFPLAGESLPRLYPTFSGDSRWLLLAGSDGGAVLWDLRPPGPDPGPRPHDLRADNSWISYAWTISPDSRWLGLVRADGRILLWALGASGPVARPIPSQPGVPATVRNVVFSEDSRRLAVTLINGRLRILDIGDEPGGQVRVHALEVGEKGGLARHPRPGKEVERQVVATDYDGRWVIVVQQTSRAGSLADPADNYVVWDVGAAGRDAIPYPLSGLPWTMGNQAINVFAGKFLVGTDLNGAVWTWDLGRGAPRIPRVFSGRFDPGAAVAFDADHERLFAADSDNAVSVIDLAKGGAAPGTAPAPPVVLRGHDRPVAAMVLAGEKGAPVLVTGSKDSEVRRWDLSHFPARLTNEPRSIRGRAGWNTVVVAPRGDWLAAATDSDPPRLWDMRHGDTNAPPLVLKGPAGPIISFVTSPDGRWLVANVATDPDGAEDKDAWAWDLDATDPTARPLIIRGIEGYVKSIQASRDGRWLAMTTLGDGRPGSLPTAAYLRDLADASPDARPTRFDDLASAIEFTPDGHWLMLAEAQRIQLLRMSAKGPEPGPHQRLPIPDVGLAPRISPDGRWLGAATRRGDLEVWPLGEAGAQTDRRRVIPGVGSIIRDFRFDPAGRRVFVRDVFGGIRISPLGELIEDRARIELDPDKAQGAAISPDGRWVARLDTDGGPGIAARLIDLSSEGETPAESELRLPPPAGRAADVIRSVAGLAFSRDGHWLVALGDTAGAIWDLSRPDAVPTSFSGQGSSIARVDIRLGRFLTIVGTDNNVQIWDLKLPDGHRFPMILRHSESEMATNIIGPDGQWALTVVSGSDNVARLWRLSAHQLKSVAEEMVGRNLTSTESKQHMYWRQKQRPTFESLPTPEDEPFMSTTPLGPMFGAARTPKQGR